MLDVLSETPLQAVFHTLAYADVFDYPLTAAEVDRYLTSRRFSLVDVLEALQNEDHFSQVGGYFTLQGREHIVETRKQREQIAERMWRKAARYGRLIARLPFVRMVAVTGSLSMNNTDAGKDVDYMIVTAPGRLWSARAFSLLIARFAKLEGVCLCPNYLITTNSLALEERSFYVAHELAQMIPLSGIDIYHQLRRLNDWVEGYLPNAAGAPALPPGVEPIATPSRLQRILEAFLRLPVGNWFETWEMNRKIRQLTREQSSSFESYFSADVCKGHRDKHGEQIQASLAVRVAGASPLLEEAG